ncbi:MAG: aminopeptidase P N-terminal domain-containing protein [Opitutaceae bacterium]|nr:aminopeptidase P N-terminal domain-containing protein [Opitutaceae bacterium]
MNPDFPARRARLAAALALTDEILLVGAGHPVPKPEISDQQFPFSTHQEYFYLTGLNDAPGAVVAFDPREGNKRGWVSFVADVSEAERVWEGRQQPPGQSLATLDAWLTARRHRPVVMLGVPLRGVPYDERRTSRVREAFTHARRPKDEAELELMRRAAVATAAGYALAAKCIRPGVTERQIQIELETGFYREGATATGYGTIVATGPNAAVLHFSPTARAVQAGEFVLIDAGAEIDRYVIDVTRTYVAGRPSAFQRDLHQVVLGGQERAIARCVAGAEWKEIHLQCAVDMIAGLVAMGVMRGHPEALVEQEAHMLLFPHGIGHMVGLGVRDGSGLLPGRARDPRPCLASLRMDLPLASGYVVTIEPGLYFIPAILNDPRRRARYREAVNWPLVDQNLQLGGVRIEDNVLVTDGAPEVLTQAIPKTL